ncbi:MAG: hypothetical protein ABIK65_13735 [Candidatus Eisenbacteria bacterium]
MSTNVPRPSEQKLVGWQKGFLLVSLLHLSLALFYKTVRGLDITASGRSWDFFWQHLPADLLRTNLLESIWNLHSQPPLYNLYGAFFIRTFPTNYLQAMHYSNILLGSLLSGMTYVILLSVTRRKRLALLLAIPDLLNPSLILYEAYVNYTFLSCFLAVTAVFFLALGASSRRPAHLAAFLLFLNLLILTRSVYHPILLLAAVPVACLVSRRLRLCLLLSVLLCLLSLGWYTKNYVKFGFFGGSSWYGINLWKASTANYSREELEKLTAEGIIDPILFQVITERKRSFHRPSVFRRFGFARTSDIEALSRDDYNNLNIVAISRLYSSTALRIIRNSPEHHLRNMGSGYLIFCRPSCRHPSASYRRMAVNSEIIGFHERIVSEYVQGLRFAEWISERTGAPCIGSFYFFLIPVSLLLFLATTHRPCFSSLESFGRCVRRNPLMWFLAILIVYVTLVSCGAEFGENYRFKFLIEPLLWCFFAGVGCQMVEAQGRRRC